MKEKKLKCYVSAAAFTNTSFVKKILLENNIEIIDFSQIKINVSLTKELKNQIRKVDFTIFVLDRENSNLFYEIGICEGLGKPILILIDQNFEASSYIYDQFYIKCSLNDNKLIRDSITNFISKNSKKNRIINLKIYDNINIQDNLLISKMNKFNKNINTEIELEHLINDLLKFNNINNVKNEMDKGVDFAIWSNKLNSYFGNPILIEAKYKISNNNLNQIISQLIKYRKASEAKFCILFYIISNNKINDKYLYDNKILAFNIYEFIDQLDNNKFEEIIINKRNMIEHGSI